MAFNEEVAVFVNTNLGTCFATAVPPDITGQDLKKELEKSHFSCFRNLGEIKVKKLKVKQNSGYCRLPESAPIKHTFGDFNKTWFVLAKAKRLKRFRRKSLLNRATAEDVSAFNSTNLTDSSAAINRKIEEDVSAFNSTNVTDSSAAVSRKIEEDLSAFNSTNVTDSTAAISRKIEEDLSAFNSTNVTDSSATINRKIDELPCATQREGNHASVFTSCSGLFTSTPIQQRIRDDPCSRVKTDVLERFRVRTTSTIPISPPVNNENIRASRIKPNVAGVGSRILVAVSKLKALEKKQRPATPLSFCRKRTKFVSLDAASREKYAIFDICYSNDKRNARKK